jgi:hypothetical protein
MTFMYLLYTDVGLVRPMDFTRTQRHPRLEAGPTLASGPTFVGRPPAGEAERVLRWVERNLTTLTHTVSMDKIKDLLPSLQPHVVGVPWTWV